MATVPRVGGSFAPPLTDELLMKYEALVNDLDPQFPVRDAMVKLLDCCKQWWDLPESVGEGKPHPSGRGNIVGLDEPIKKALWDHIPWSHELKAFGVLFDGIDPVKQKELRDAAHHLLWHVVELDLDREPITTDKL